MMELRPLFNRVVVRRVDSETVTRGGIFIPDNAAEKADQGTVLAVGPGKRENGELIPVDVAVGDRVLFGKTAGQTVKVNDEEVLILDEEQILAVVK
jgi:chaperonin GroES